MNTQTSSAAIERTAPATGAAAGITITGLQNSTAQSRQTTGGPLVIALHGGGFTSQYFDIAGYSLLELAESRGIPAIALDRPSTGGSTPLAETPEIIAANAAVLDAVIAEIWAEWEGAASGVVLIGHSIGGAVAIDIAGNQPAWPLLGIAVSGNLLKTTDGGELPPVPMIALPPQAIDSGMFGPVESLAADMPAACHPAIAPVPRAELVDIGSTWTDRVRAVAAKVLVPVHDRQAEYDALWVTNAEQVAEFAAAFSSSPSVDARIEPGVGHAIDFHLAGRSFQNSQLDFAVDCAS